ncbi:hypothetical protein SDC9_93900 [bioreactor metagenome]|uniref:Cyclic beta-(1,2)-glucan synthase NdvB n=1 Tax=bioreactor metagenome TaxID=1076179 RepID=A0A645A2D9_9ZZZZ
MLCNKHFGWFVDETGGGHLWLENARENQLTPWPNDPLAIGGPEYFYLRTEGRLISLFADADALECTVTYRPGIARWEKRFGGRTVTTTAFVPMEQDVRFLIIELTGEEGELVHRVAGQGETCYPMQDATVLCTFPDEKAMGIKSFLQSGQGVGDAKQLLNRTIMEWSRRVSSLRVRTPNQKLNDYLNGWALYQVTACRLWGRTSRYQNGGAYGFRDQLQDVCALIPTSPETVSEQILRSCAHQYEEGDVQHWWHESKESSKGVRTRISDDLLWLPYTLCKLWETWGDDEVFDQKAPYLISPVLGPEERERYEEPGVSTQSERVYDHAVRAVELFLERGRGSHALARIGTGDWNDGMNLVGTQGRGESVWLSWFAAHVLYRFSDVCGHLGDGERVERYRQAAKELAEAANAAWDGKWFLRGYYDDGSTLGSCRDQYCQIDSIAQSFAVLSGYGEKEKSEQAVRSAVRRLYHPERGVVQLFDPPFDRDGTDPGYIKGYLPGVRENGGQYTHGAVWLAMASLRMGDVRSGYDILNALLPASHDPEIYKTEPYVLSADVYFNPAHAGRGGWSWYTGAAGWYYRAATEELLGLRINKGRLTMSPRLPTDWPGYTALWRNEDYTLHIVVERGERTELTLDGEPCPEGLLLNECSGEHTLCFTFHE